MNSHGGAPDLPHRAGIDAVRDEPGYAKPQALSEPCRISASASPA